MKHSILKNTSMFLDASLKTKSLKNKINHFNAAQSGTAHVTRVITHTQTRPNLPLS